MPLARLLKKTLHSVTRPQVMLLMALGAALAVLVAAGVIAALTWLTANMVNLERQWLDTTVNWLVGIILGIGGWFMLPVLVVLISGIFQDITIHRVERSEYPDRVRRQEPRVWPDLAHDIRFTLKALLLNLLVLPFYLVGIGFALSVALNSYLMGREFFEGAAGYHLGKPRAREMGSRHKGMVYGSGLVITLLTLAPVVNLFVPVIAIIWMVHAYHLIDAGRVPCRQ